MSSSITDRIRDLLESIPPFDRLPEEARAELLTDVSIEHFNAGEVVLEQGTTVHKGLYIVESGLVRLMDVEQARMLDKCSEGDFFGSFGLLKGGAAIYQAKAVEPTVCILLKGERFRSLYEQHEDFGVFFESDLKRYVRHIDKELDVAGAHLLFSRRLNQFTHREPVSCAPETTAQQAARVMRREGVGSILVVQDERLTGILTSGDLMKKLVARGGGAETPVRRLMTAPVATVSAEASLFEAMLIMINRRVRRLVILDEAGTPVGLLTDRDVAHFRGQDPVATVHRIEGAPSVAELVSIRAETSEQLLRLYKQGVQPEMVNSIMSVIYDRLVVRVLELAEKDLRARHADLRVDLPWVWMRLGSGGRAEMALNSQQHNALLYANPATEDEAARAERWFDLVAERVNEDLVACGFTMSQFVARDPRWRQSLRSWKQTYRSWILQADEAELVGVPVFFDLRGIYGRKTLVDDLKRDLVDALNVQAMDPDRQFLGLMAAAAVEHKPPLSFFKRFAIDRSGEHRNTFDIRERGVLPLVNAARVLALELRYFESTNTFDRLRAAAAALPDLERTLEAGLEAYRFLVDFRLEDQLKAFESGEPIDNRIEPYALRKEQQSLLRGAFEGVVALQEALTRRYGVQKGRAARARRA